jgi:hypothetical protein
MTDQNRFFLLSKQLIVDFYNSFIIYRKRLSNKGWDVNGLMESSVRMCHTARMRRMIEDSDASAPLSKGLQYLIPSSLTMGKYVCKGGKLPNATALCR